MFALSLHLVECIWCYMCLFTFLFLCLPGPPWTSLDLWPWELLQIKTIRVYFWGPKFFLVNSTLPAFNWLAALPHYLLYYILHLCEAHWVMMFVQPRPHPLSGLPRPHPLSCKGHQWAGTLIPWKYKSRRDPKAMWSIISNTANSSVKNPWLRNLSPWEIWKQISK